MNRRPKKLVLEMIARTGEHDRRTQHELYAWSRRRGELIQVDVRTFLRYVRRHPDAPWRRETFADRGNGQHTITVDDSRAPAPTVRAVGGNQNNPPRRAVS